MRLVDWMNITLSLLALCIAVSAKSEVLFLLEKLKIIKSKEERRAELQARMWTWIEKIGGNKK